MKKSKYKKRSLRKAKRKSLKKKLVCIAEQKDVTLLIAQPFKTSKSLNKHYFKMTQALEEETNRLVLKTINGDAPHSRRTLRDYLGISRQHMDYIFRRFMHNGILMRVFVFGQEMLYLNPAFAVKGETSKELKRFFEYKGDLLYGEFSLDINKSPYKREEVVREMIKDQREKR